MLACDSTSNQLDLIIVEEGLTLIDESHQLQYLDQIVDQWMAHINWELCMLLGLFHILKIDLIDLR